MSGVVLVIKYQFRVPDFYLRIAIVLPVPGELYRQPHRGLAYSIAVGATLIALIHHLHR